MTPPDVRPGYSPGNPDVGRYSDIDSVDLRVCFDRTEDWFQKKKRDAIFLGSVSVLHLGSFLNIPDAYVVLLLREAYRHDVIHSVPTISSTGRSVIAFGKEDILAFTAVTFHAIKDSKERTRKGRVKINPKEIDWDLAVAKTRKALGVHPIALHIHDVRPISGTYRFPEEGEIFDASTSQTAAMQEVPSDLVSS